MPFHVSSSPSCLSAPRSFNKTPKLRYVPETSSTLSSTVSFPHFHPMKSKIPSVRTFALNKNSDAAVSESKQQTKNSNQKEQQKIGEGEVEVEEELPWIQDKALDLVEFTGSVTQAFPGPRVGTSSLPWILAVPLAYAGITFVIAVVRTVKKLTSPRAQRKKLVNKNATLCKSIDELFQRGREAVQESELKGLEQKTGFSMDEILRKYIRYALNLKPFNPDLVADLIQLRKASALDDAHVAEVLNEISRRIVREKGPIVMDKSGFTEKGFKRKLAVQTLFGKVFYISELPEFCSKDSSLIVKEIFGATDEDAEKLRIHSLSEAGAIDSLEKMIGGSDLDDSEETESEAP